MRTHFRVAFPAYLYHEFVKVPFFNSKQKLSFIGEIDNLCRPNPATPCHFVSVLKKTRVETYAFFVSSSPISEISFD